MEEFQNFGRYYWPNIKKYPQREYDVLHSNAGIEKVTFFKVDEAFLYCKIQFSKADICIFHTGDILIDEIKEYYEWNKKEILGQDENEENDRIREYRKKWSKGETKYFNNVTDYIEMLSTHDHYGEDNYGEDEDNFGTVRITLIKYKNNWYEMLIKNGVESGWYSADNAFVKSPHFRYALTFKGSTFLSGFFKEAKKVVFHQ